MGKIIGIGVVVLVVLIGAFWAIGVSNDEKKLFLTGKAAQNDNEVVFDNTWKKIQTEET